MHTRKAITFPIRAFAVFSAILFVAVALLFLTGCAHERVVVRARQTNDVPVLSTNVAPVVSRLEVVKTELNPVSGGPEIRTTNFVTVTNLVTEVQTNIVRIIIPEVAYTNVSLHPTVGAAVQVGGELAPVPWAGAATGIFGIVAGGIATLINESRRRKALGEAQSWQQTAGVLVDNVEAIRKLALTIPGYTPQLDAKVVRGIETAQRVAGVKDKVHALVEERTDDTLPIA